MKHTINFFLVLGVLLSLSSSVRCLAGQNCLAPDGLKGEALLLAESGTAFYEILLSKNSNTVEQKAAEDLAHWLSVMSGADFKIAYEVQKGRVPRKFISIGKTKKLADSLLRTHFKPPGENGYVIAGYDGNLYLWGPSIRGVINAVYSLLEEDMGCRWYTRSVTRIPRHNRLIVRPVYRSFTPVLKQRLPYYKDAFDKDWALRNRTSYKQPEQWGGAYGSIRGVHTLGKLLPEKKYFVEHPEFYSFREAKRSPLQVCLSNDKAAKTVADNVKKILRKNHDIKIISVSLKDGRGYCCCEKCLAIDKQNGYNPATPEKHRSGSLVYFINNVAQEIEKEFPDVLISTLAYLGTSDPPTKIKPRKNVAIRLCNDMHSWRYPLIDFVDCDQPESKRFREIVKGWSEICDNIFIWEYTSNFRNYLFPLGNMNRIEPMVRYYIDHDVKGIMFQGDYTSFGGSRVPMRSWVLAKYLWDPSRNVEELIKDFAKGMYGNSACDILRYYKMLDQIGLDYQQGKRPLENMCRTFGIDQNFVLKAMEIFQEAEKKADNEEVLRRVQLEMLPVLYLAAYHQYDFLNKEQILKMIDDIQLICRRERITAFAEGIKNTQRKIDFLKSRANFSSQGIKWAEIGEHFKFKALPTFLSESDTKLWTKMDFDDTKWQTISGWKLWDEQGYSGFAGTGWYRKRFKIPAEWSRKNELCLLFGGIDEQCVIYINGHRVHEHTRKAKKTSFKDLYKMKVIFPINKYIDWKKENILVLEVFNNIGAGGMYQPMFLVSCNRPLNAQVVWEYVLSQR